LDHTANTYYALSAIIVAGLNGIEEKLKLAEPVNRDPEHEKQLPLNFETCLNNLSGELGQIFHKAFGIEFINDYVALRSFENE